MYVHTHGHSSALMALFAFFLVTWMWPSTGMAQRDSSLEAMLKTANLEGKAVDSGPIPKSNVAEVNLQVHWRLWKQVSASGGPGIDELKALEHDGRSLGRVNQVTRSLAVAGVAGSQKDPKSGHAMFVASQALSPDLPYPYFAHTRYLIDRQLAEVPRWVSTASRGYQAAWRWPDTRFPWSLKVLVFAMLAVLAAGFSFLVAQTMRQFGIVAYDLARVMPKGFSSNQTVVLVLAVVVVPGVLLKSPLLVLLSLAVAVSIPQCWNERLISAVIFSAVASLPWVDKLADNLASYSGSTTQTLVAAQYVNCDLACLEDLAARSAASPDDLFILYTDMLAQYRTGDPKAQKRIVEEVGSRQWPTELLPYASNLAGVSELALGKPQKALEWFAKAEKGMPEEAAPAFNAMRAHQMLDDLDAASTALSRATLRNVNQVSVYLTYDRRDVNSFVMAPGLPLDVFWDYHLSQPREARSVVAPYWSAIAGRELALEHATPVGAAGVLLVVLGAFVRRGGKLSTPCPKCGLARDPRDDATTGAHHLCLPCYRTFVTGAGLDYKARVYNERVLGGRSRFQSGLRRVTSFVAPGTGHHLAGRSITGFFVGSMFVLGLLFIFLPVGLVRPPHELMSDNWGGFWSLGWLLASGAGFTALHAALRDIDPIGVGRSKRGGRR